MNPTNAAIPTLEPEPPVRRKAVPLWLRLLRSALLLCVLGFGLCFLLAWDTVRANRATSIAARKILGWPMKT